LKPRKRKSGKNEREKPRKEKGEDMKNILIGLALLMTIGCAGINTGVATNVATDAAFVMAMQNNPAYKIPVVAGLQAVKVFLAGDVTYDALITEISKQFAGQYAYIGVILSGYIETDKPVSTSAISLLDSYKAAVVAKIDRLILLAG